MAHARLVAWVEENIAETPTRFSPPQARHKNMKSTNMLERLGEEIKRRTRVVRIFPNEASCLRLIRALAAEQHETWREDNRHINMALLKEMKRERLKAAARACPGSPRGLAAIPSPPPSLAGSGERARAAPSGCL